MISLKEALKMKEKADAYQLNVDMEMQIISVGGGSLVYVPYLSSVAFDREMLLQRGFDIEIVLKEPSRAILKKSV